MFYYEQFFRTALNGIDRSNIMPATIQISQVILLISFLVAVYESYIRGGDVRMLGIAAVKYVGVGLVLLSYAGVFRDVNSTFNSFEASTPVFTVTNATTLCPFISSGLPTTAASATLAWLTSALSISEVPRRCPATLRTSSIRKSRRYQVVSFSAWPSCWRWENLT